MRIVFVGAHPDDIELNAGGLVSKMVGQGEDVDFVIVTDGCYTGLDGHERTSITAEFEQNKVKEFGIKNIYFLNYPNGSFLINNGLIADIERYTIGADVVVTHNLFEVHHDHTMVSHAVFEACRNNKNLLNWITPILNKTKGDVDGDKGIRLSKQEITKKIEMIKCHKTEFLSRNGVWEDRTIVQAKFYGYKFFGEGFAECYKTIINLEG